MSAESPNFKTRLEEWLPNKGNWKACWRATRDGWESFKFHNNCDGKSPTLVIIEVFKNSKYLVFGGYSTAAWTIDSKF